MTQRSSGPVRSEASRRAILDATARQLGARGYDQLTIEGIAAEAKVGKQTIYRWWGSKSALVAECLLEGGLLPASLNPKDTGDLKQDLANWLRAVFAFASDPANGSLMRSILAAAVDNEAVGRMLGRSLGADSAIQARLRRAAEDGQLDPATPLDELVKALVGWVVMHCLERAPIPPALPAALIAAIIP
ncbi:MAG: TetR/AcrR family transcriptional regulator [Bifidobacteriaceae bacterium]|jgi:AcrR family transcriptional regulator|nr:TetR/AcrR family transcriptional regulator [Bifidobacteriaceae bacterium]